MKKILSLVLIALLCVGLLAACASKDDGKDIEAGLANAKEYLDTQMNDKAESTPDDYTVYKTLPIIEDGAYVIYNITWTVSGKDGATLSENDVKVVVGDEDVTVVVNKGATADIPYLLTATIERDGKTVSTTYERKVPAFKELSHAQFTATADNTAVVIKGIVNGIVNTSSKWELYLQDNDGGYYLYGLKKEQVQDLQIGQEVRVRGIKGTYYGVHQVNNATIEVLNATPVAVEARDITEAIKAAGDLTVKDVTKYQSMYVKISGVNILGQISGDDSYYDFRIGDSLQAYLRISSSANMLNAADTATFTTTFMDNVGSDADAYGIVSIFNNKIYLIPVTKDAITNLRTMERTPAQQVEYEKELLDSLGSISKPGRITLQSEAKVYGDVTFSWALAETDYAYLESNGNVLRVPMLPDEEQTIALTLTLANGDASTTKEYNLKIKAAPSVVADSDVVVAPGTGYALVVRQNNLSAVLFWDGTMSGNYLATTDDATKAAIIKAQLVEGTTDKYILYVQSGEQFKYINVTDTDEYTTPSISLARSADGITNYFTYDSERNIFTVEATVLAKKDSTETKKVNFYFGCYKDFDTIGLSDVYYIEGSNAANVGVTQFPAQFSTLVEVKNTSAADQVAREKNDLDIKVNFLEKGEILLPINGGLFFNVQISWAVADNNGAVAIVDGKLVAVPQSEDTTVVVTATLTLGEATDTKTFEVVVAKIPTTVPVQVTEAPEEGQYYIAVMKGGETLSFLTGEIGNAEYRLAIGALAEAALFDVKVVDGGYTISRTVDGTTTYINIRANDNYTNCLYESESKCVWVWDDELKTLVVDVDGTKFTLTNTSANYANVEAKKLTVNPGWKAYLVKLVDSSSISDADKVATEKDTLVIEDDYKVAGTTTLPTVGSTYDDVTITYEFVGAVDAGLATLVDGVLTIVKQPATDTTVQIKAVITCGEASDEKVFDVTIRALALTSIPDALAAGLEGKTDTVVVEGVVVNNINTKYGNIWLADANGNLIYLYGLKDENGTVQNPAYGTTIRVLATTSVYGGAGQLANSVVVASTEPTADTKVIVAWYALSVKTSFDADGTLTLPTSADATITWTKDGAAYTDATIAITQTSETQQIKLVATVTNGTVTLTKEFTVVVNAVVSDDAVSVKKTHTEIAAIAGVTAGQNTGVISNKEIALDDNITIVCAKGGASSDPCIYTESIRLYQNGSTMTITAKEGYIATVILTIANNAAGDGPINVTGGTASELTNYTYTITADADTSEIVITTAGTDKNSRCYIAAVEVIYVAA